MKRSLLIAILVAPLLVSGCSGKSGHEQAEVQREQITGVETTAASIKSLPETLEAAGSIKAATIGVVSSKIMGTVTSVRVAEGQRVSRGEVLLTIDDSHISQKAAGAEASFKEASFGLENARKQLALSEATHQNVHLELDENAEKLDKDAQGMVFYVIEEAVGNARKHAEASDIWITARREDAYLIEVRDNGKGFDVNKVQANYDKRGSLGMINMSERAEVLKAKLSIASAVGQGTRVMLRVPLERIAS